MRSITNAAHHRQDGYRSVVKLVSSSPSLSITEANIVQGGFTYDSRVVEGSAFQVGTAIADEIHVTLDNSTGVYNRSYLGVEFTVSISCKNISTGTQDSWYQLGLFTVTEVDESNSVTTTMTLQDRMLKLDQVIPSFSVSTLYSNLSSFCTALGITLVTTNTNPLQKWTVVSTTNENNITYRDFVRGCALLLGRNARFTNDGKLEFTQNIASSAVATLNTADRFSSRLGELQHLGGVEVYDGEGVLLFSRNTHNNDTYRTVIDPSSSVIFEILGGIEAVVTGFQACVSSGSSYYPHSFNINMDYYPCEVAAMNWWELQTWDKVSYTKNGTTYPIIVTSVASVLNGRTSITSTAEDENNRYVPSQTDESRTTSQSLQEAADNAQDRADDAYDLAGDAMSAASDAEKVATNYLTFTNQNGLDVGYSGTQAKTRISGSGVEIFDASGRSMEYIGAQNNQPYARMGYASQGHIATSAGGLKIYYNNQELAHLGWGEIVNSVLYIEEEDGTLTPGLSYTGDGAYYTFGNRSTEWVDNEQTTHQGEIGENSFVMGISSVASAPRSAIIGRDNVALISDQMVVGRFNDPSEPGLFVVGNGTDPDNSGARSNAIVVGGDVAAMTVHGKTVLDGNAEVFGTIAANPKSESRTIPSVSGVTVGSLQVYTTAGLCMVTLELTLTGEKSSWTTIATGLPLAAFAWYDTASSWGTSYARSMRVRVDTSGNLQIRYGAATSYRISFCYPMATAVG